MTTVFLAVVIFIIVMLLLAIATRWGHRKIGGACHGTGGSCGCGRKSSSEQCDSH